MDQPPVVLITGASAGVGRATAIAFGRVGARVALLARGRGGLEATRRDVEAAGGRALVLPVDVADAAGVEHAASEAEQTLGPINVWVNCAMVTVFSPFLQLTPEEFKRVTEVTYLGYVYGTMSALRRMVPRDRGVIVQVGSALAYRSIPLQSAYCGAKHAIQGFTESIWSELIHDKSRVRITMVHLPALNTPQFEMCRAKLARQPQPVPPIYQPEVAAEAIVWASRHPRREVFVGGSTAVVINGNKLAPGLGDAYLGKTGYEAQQTDEPLQPDRADNLFEPVPGDHGARGRFTDRSHTRSLFFQAAKYRGWLAAGAAGLGGLLLAGLARQR